ncbi:site-specific integrase [uncultured Rikenella sp.]|uniref:site-specific integrase n=1 Tax=uncultured Rikenella sp. TaxID=368003 RepID=UPI00261D993B|nr:site-specific integrase [uncultured Rikenella sp.]
MYKYAKDGVTVSSVLDTRRAKKNGLFPVKIQVAYKRVQKYYPTGKELDTAEWKRLLRTRSGYLLEVRRDIGSSFDRIKRHVQELTEKEPFSFDALNRLLGRGKGDTLNSLFRHRISRLTAEQRVGNMLWYDNVFKSIKRFSSRAIPLTAVTVVWLRRYEKFLLGEQKSPVTICMHMRAIRALLNEARKNGNLLDTQYPFGQGKFEIQEGEGRKIALNLRQIKQIVDFSNGNPTTAHYRDLWFFIYLCNGINVADLIRLKYADIIDGEICFVRQKTARTTKTRKEIRAIITPEMRAILGQWGNPPVPENFLFPFLNGHENAMELKIKTQNLTRQINRHMHQIGLALGIGPISTYTARHSFATILKRQGANISYISESLGHSNLRTTACYLAGFEKDERIKNARLLTDFKKSKK